MATPVHATHTITSVFNFKTSKAFAFSIMLFFSIYHGFQMLTRPGGNLCKSLLSDGSAGPGGEWRPYGCMTHIYSKEDSKLCMQQLATWGDQTRVYFMGDSRLFNLFTAFEHHLDEKKHPPLSASFKNQSSSDLSVYVKREAYELCFFHFDEVTADVVQILDVWKAVHNKSTYQRLRLSRSLSDDCIKHPPTHLVLSFGSKTVMRFNHSDLGLLSYHERLDSLAASLSSLSFVRTVWMLQDPVAEGLLTEERKMITNDELDAYNNIAEKVMQGLPGVEIWRSNRLIAQRMGFPAVSWRCPSSDLTNIEQARLNGTGDRLENPKSLASCTEPPPLSDGFHVSTEAMYHNVQVLLNLYCNNQMKFEDGTCCRSAEPVTSIQKRCFIFIGLCLLASIFCFVYDTCLRPRISQCHWLSTKWSPRWFSCRWRVRSTTGLDESKTTYPQQPGALKPESSTFQEFYELTTVLSEFGLILIYFFVCDRTVLFMKTNKGFTVMSFLLPMTYLFVLGLFFSGPTKETRLNHVDITREWKGWMQLYFLVYHFTGSYRVLPLHLFTRFFTSAYLFLSGFGHFYYLWHHPLPESLVCKLLPCCFSLDELCIIARAWWAMFHRYLDVVYRLNFSVLGLCLIMNRDYMFYYFMPLITFWFTVTMLVILLFPRVSDGSLTRDARQVVRSSNILVKSSEKTSYIRGSHNNVFDVDSKSSPTSPCLNKSRDPRGLFVELPQNLRPVQSSSNPDPRSHQKALSMGTGFDLRQWSMLPPPTEPRITKKTKLTTKSGPPWSEDLIRRVWSSTATPITVSALPGRPRLFLAAKRYCRCFPVQLADLIILIKIALLIAGIEWLYRSPSLFHFVFFSGIQKFLFQATMVAPSSYEKLSNDAELHGEGGVWFYRWSIDRYSVVYGMLFALLCEWARRAKCLNDLKSGDLGLPAPPTTYATQTNLTSTPRDTPDKNVDSSRFTFDPVGLDTRSPMEPHLSTSSGMTSNLRTKCRAASSSYTNRRSFYTAPQFSTSTFQTMGSGYGFLSKITCRRFTAVLLTILGAVGIGVYMLITFQCNDHDFCTEAHTFLCLLPIISYILLRNCLGLMRRSHSTFFAWFGDISLELYLAQHHIWLSADANGILVLLPGYPLLNLALTSFVFVCVCRELHNITLRLKRFLVPNNAFIMFRNLILFGITLHLITKATS